MTRELASLTWEEARARLSGAVVILPVGATEAHGPHLPLGTDVVIAEAMARAAAELLEARGRPAIVLPSLAYSPAGYAAGFAGTISLRPATLTALVLDVARSLGSQGIRALGIANAHLDPEHLAALRGAAGERPEAGLPPIVFPDLTRRPWGSRLTEEFRSGACHAGRFEGSVIMAERPELVREAVRAGLPPNPISLSKAIRAGAATFEEAGGSRAYFGDPAAATPEEGRETVAVLGGILADAVDEALAGRS
ncbi:MAG TPA: creatininase family protein [Gemmatimonadota bacterium]|nr:creatininase family protein [Gemmatimonadota bacterium]